VETTNPNLSSNKMIRKIYIDRSEIDKIDAKKSFLLNLVIKTTDCLTDFTQFQVDAKKKVSFNFISLFNRPNLFNTYSNKQLLD
jgi:hypothetical protein